MSQAGDYLSMTKPPIIVLLVITAVGAMFLASGGLPPLMLVIFVCVGGQRSLASQEGVAHQFVWASAKW